MISSTMWPNIYCISTHTNSFADLMLILECDVKLNKKNVCGQKTFGQKRNYDLKQNLEKIGV